MDERVRVGAVIAEGGAATVEAFGRTVAVFRDGGRLYALDDTCPHRGASLSKGTIIEGAIECPLHAWRFGLADGVMTENPGVRQRCFEVEEIDGEIFVRRPE